MDLENLLDEQKEAVFNMFEEVSSVFSQNEYDVQAADVTEHKIILTDQTPFYQRPRRLPEPISQEIEAQCRELEAMDIIERSISSWSSNMVPIRKGDGNIRLCVDYRS